MGAGTSAEEFFLKSVNVESIFEFIERTDYLFLYSIKECVEKSDCHEGVYLSEVAEYMKLSIPETSKMVKSLENKGYIIWKLDEKKERTYLVLTNKAIELSNCQKEKMTEVLSIGFGISTDWTMKSAIITTVVFVLLPHIGMGIVAVIEVVKCGLQEFIFG